MPSVSLTCGRTPVPEVPRGLPGTLVRRGLRTSKRPPVNRCSAMPGPSTSVSVHAEYTRVPPGLRRSRADPTSAALHRRQSLGRSPSILQRASGRRRGSQAEHGASTSTRSNVPGGTWAAPVGGHHRQAGGVGADETDPRPCGCRPRSPMHPGRQHLALPPGAAHRVDDPLTGLGTDRFSHPLAGEVLHIAVGLAR